MANLRASFFRRIRRPSMGKPFVAILTLELATGRPGTCARSGFCGRTSPLSTRSTGADVSVCGNCPHRRQADGSCDPVTSTWDRLRCLSGGTYKAGGYQEDLTVADGEKYLKTRKIRWGAYGDPAIIDPVIFHAVNGAAAGHTGYTHQWREAFAQWSKPTGILLTLTLIWKHRPMAGRRSQWFLRDRLHSPVSNARPPLRTPQHSAGPVHSVTGPSSTCSLGPMAPVQSTSKASDHPLSHHPISTMNIDSASLTKRNRLTVTLTLSTI